MCHQYLEIFLVFNCNILSINIDDKCFDFETSIVHFQT